MKFLQYRRLVWASLFLLWPPSLWAAALTFGQSMRDISYASFIGWGLLSTLSGVTALFYRIDRELRRTGARLPHAGVFVTAHLTGSWTAGLVAMLGGEAAAVNGLLTAVSIILFAFVGAAALERLAESRLGLTMDKRDAPP